MGFKPYSIAKQWILDKNVRIKDYEILSDDDKAFIDYTIQNSIKENPELRVGFRIKNPKQLDFWKLSWDDIILIRHHLSEKDIQNVIKLLYQIKDKQFLSLNLFNSTAVYKWVAKQIKAISDIEKQELQDEPTSEEKAAGIEKLQEFGYAVSLDALSKGNLLEEKKLLQKPYSIIFRKLCLNKAKSDIQKEYSENARRKNQRSMHR